MEETQHEKNKTEKDRLDFFKRALQSNLMRYSTVNLGFKVI